MYKAPSDRPVLPAALFNMINQVELNLHIPHQTGYQSLKMFPGLKDIPINQRGFIYVRNQTARRGLDKLKIPAVVVTGYGGVELARKAIDQYHAFDFMEKQTLDLNRLREVIKAAFKKVKGKEKELRELREKVFRGEIITFDVPDDAVNPLLREEREDYGQ